MAETIYNKKGFKNREEYLQSLSDEYGIDYYIVFEIAYTLGESEDFDGLVSSLEDLNI